MKDETGREPTEPTDAELLRKLMDIHQQCGAFDNEWGEKWNTALLAVYSRGEEYLSGQRPLPVLGVDPALPNAEYTAGYCPRCDTPVYHRLGKPGEYDHECPLPDTPDQVAQLHGGMCPQIVAGNFIVQCNGIVRDKAGVLLFQLEDYAPLTARVAELEAAMEKIADWHGHWGPYPEKREDWRSMAIVTAREAVPLSAPGKEPTDA